ncbi:transient receptor potential cation channel subfamily A member 1 homolog isoform X3 [Eurytemora carolleeae]|uniref:transient receptor potential cation channel subfamily A member 1 homolog isoform X3 n=1 Tax=Eurytemora carolleeae TaxID=1294199 RepID=UPI000C772F90|nr:transient receptor potential cation channel subfamily A member 1 homolog isoform X3 [Eurytemora carolleeae]|eukprot:XP_023336897.1 transient receptor potential cation channel subfamily A member 1 homolog isoform X3 [Eurytemora affinis]
MIQAIFWIVKEFLQFLQRQLNYLSWDNLMDIFCYIAGFLIVFDFDDCQSLTGLRRDWQWQLGAFTVTLAWLNFLSLLRKFPFFGIYVLMFSDVLQTFLKVSVIIALFVLAFSFGFYALVADQAPFGNGWYSIMKTFVMTIGELEYADLFFADESGGNNTSVTYELSTFAFFFVFVIIMPIIITNLLVGLAVDDIQSVQENAVLQRLAMQVELNLSVETMLPEFVRRRLLRRFEKFYPNRPRSIISRIFSDEINLTNDLTEGTESDTEILASNQV